MPYKGRIALYLRAENNVVLLAANTLKVLIFLY